MTSKRKMSILMKIDLDMFFNVICTVDSIHSRHQITSSLLRVGLPNCVWNRPLIAARKISIQFYVNVPNFYKFFEKTVCNFILWLLIYYKKYYIRNQHWILYLITLIARCWSLRSTRRSPMKIGSQVFTPHY